MLAVRGWVLLVRVPEQARAVVLLVKGRGMLW